MTSASVPASIRRIAQMFSGMLGVAARDLASAREVLLNADEVFPTASMAKIPILLELYRQHESGKLLLGETLTLRKRGRVGGSGVIVYMDDALTLNLRNLAVLMMSISDNSATNALVERLGIDNINGAMRAAGMTNSHLHRKIKMKLPDKPKHPF
ncbi:MAG: class A beta-lactamase-related serine hydrolase, partial [Chloroflexi bacterium]|nr:class A beta-lactamase-related serine hydrolase [Chloroflexota bacterium]